MNILLETQFLPPIPYWKHFFAAEKVIIDDQERYVKRSYRNRCTIATANGPLNLSIPLKQGKTLLPVIEVQIDFSRPWQKEHWHSIQSAYGRSAFFEYYKDEFKDVFLQELPLLFDYNLQLLRLICRFLHLPQDKIKLLSECEGMVFISCRNTVSYHLSTNDCTLTTPYSQPFADRLGFLPDLSIMDLVFNEGKQAKDILLKS